MSTTPSSKTKTQRAIALQEAGRLDEATRLYRQAIRDNPSDDVAHHNLGLIASSKHDYATAQASIEISIQLKPNEAFYRSNYATVLRAMGRFRDAIAEAEHALAIQPRLAAAWNNMGLAYLDLGRHDEAAHAFEEAIALNSKYVEAISNFALLRTRQKRFAEAQALSIRALRLKPDHYRALLSLGDSFHARHQYGKAQSAYRRALSIAPTIPDAFIRLGRTLGEIGDAAGAREQVEHAVKLAPKAPTAHFELGLHLRFHGFLDDAASAFREALRLDPRFFAAYAPLAKTVSIESREAPEFQSMLQAHDIVPPDSPARGELAFGIGEAFEAMGEYREAFNMFLEGNRIRRMEVAYSEAAQQRRLEAVRTVFDSAFLGRHADRGNRADSPIFILGMPRSGTTLTEQIVTMAPDVFGAGELSLIVAASSETFGFFTFDEMHNFLGKEDTLNFEGAGTSYLNWLTGDARTARRFTDKMPHNFWLIGLIHLMLPNARIIHVQRSPLDNCLSIFKASFAASGLDYSYDLRELGRYYNIYRSVMAHWRRVLPGAFYELQYESLVDDAESESKKLFDYLELKWSPSVLDFHQSRRGIKTASAAQVRRPIYKTSVNLSERYGELLDPLRAALDEWREDEPSAS